ncbi:hypothetical protein PoB_002781700 [Plakobranchus ocellatus]|uniref:Uncharacterized protein n=1 Tax=Plakobranchus ocellatus TaxID=259542 RepID=A0AAV4A1Y8_9GAST|nr:hypothetical protein PoB_002781700 [Plakobranchus ocellatus]
MNGNAAKYIIEICDGIHRPTDDVDSCPLISYYMYSAITAPIGMHNTTANSLYTAFWTTLNLGKASPCTLLKQKQDSSENTTPPNSVIL